MKGVKPFFNIYAYMFKISFMRFEMARGAKASQLKVKKHKNNRNGAEILLSEEGKPEIEILRDRAGKFEPQPKEQTKMAGKWPSYESDDFPNAPNLNAPLCGNHARLRLLIIKAALRPPAGAFISAQ